MVKDREIDRDSRDRDRDKDRYRDTMTAGHRDTQRETWTET